MAHYIHDEKNNRIEGMSKEEIYALLAAAIQSGELPSVDEDTAFVTMFKSIVDGKTYKMAFCTQAQYNELKEAGELVVDALYYITDDDTLELIEQLETEVEEFIDYVNEAISTGLRQRITSISTPLLFTTWNSSTTISYAAGYVMQYLIIGAYTNNQVYILPTDSINSIAEATVEYVSGDNGYIEYNLYDLGANQNYIQFTATNISNYTIYAPNNVPSDPNYTLCSTTFKLRVKDVYGAEFTQEFTISYYGHTA